MHGTFSVPWILYGIKCVGKYTNTILVGGFNWESFPQVHRGENKKDLSCHIKVNTLPETNSSHLKMNGWKMIASFWGPAYFQG